MHYILAQPDFFVERCTTNALHISPMKKAQPKISTAIRVKPDLLKEFKKAAAQQGVSFTFFLNRQMQLAVEAHNRKQARAKK